MIKLVVLLVTGDLDLVDIGHHDEITGVDMRCVDRLLLSAQTMRTAARQASKHLVIGVDDIPIPRDVLRLGGIGFHGKMTCPVKFCKVLDGSTLRAYLSNQQAASGRCPCPMASAWNETGYDQHVTGPCVTGHWLPKTENATCVGYGSRMA